MEQVRVGVVGTGRMGRNHCRIFSILRNATLVGISDQNPAVGRNVAREYAVPYFPNIDELLPHVDAISLAVPTPLHYGLALRCIEQGVHVFVEKPITESLDDAGELVLAADRSDLVVQVGHIERFNPTYTELKNVLEDLTPLAINFQRLSPYVGSNTDVDVVLDLMIHDLDLALDMVGEMPTSITASGITALSGAVDHAVVGLRFPQGPLLTLTASRLTEQKVRQVEVTALEAFVQADLLNKSVAVHRSMVGEYLNGGSQRGVKYRQESVVERIHVPIAEPLYLELQHFVESIRTRRQPLVTARDGALALELAHRIRQELRGQLLDAASLRSKPMESSTILEVAEVA